MVDLPELVIDRGDGKYKVRINIDLLVKDGKLTATGITQSVKKDMSHLGVMPDAFAEIVSEHCSTLSAAHIRKFYHELFNAGPDGITQRELMRACGPHMNLETVSVLLPPLEKFGWIQRIDRHISGQGRPRTVILLRDHSI